MPAEVSDAVLAQAISLMREGRIQDADNLLSAHRSSKSTGGSAAKPAAPPPPPPRPRDDILIDFVHNLVEQIGSPHALVTLVQELDRSYAAAAAPAAKE